ncbi:hypothetical protein CC1G_12330 [Coprinopsis cinerea okayama7|uniref:DUF1524 domain-containing protein n=1 Tax=Coprinopsis cinerea (strain Okayama-7 / 130 / ATCC MYA-4618 / FGSC 9003) TaxID=240176 RepID=A8P2Q3_COPC7|nr:hypothetical protein CC1G_12330 [Coprinopsis cinerea okayama7\|eukprot:XP_001838380.2 hypothetical protein CC1G_12330 [Coprinopsis cinerea okayama7\
MKLTTALAIVPLAVLSLAAPLEQRALPTPVSAATARTYLSQSVLKRDGTNVVTGSNCAATSGHWVSPYDNVPTTLASDLDIDHLVPLKEAWVSGARYWTTAQRQAFANDLIRPQLVAVTDDYRCTYARAWVQVKRHYNLSVDSAEKAALTSILNGC